MTPPSRKSLPPLPATSTQDWFNTNWPILTKVVVFLLGVSIMVNEFFFQPEPNLTAVGGAFALVGVVPFTYKSNGNGNGK